MGIISGQLPLAKTDRNPDTMIPGILTPDFLSHAQSVISRDALAKDLGYNVRAK